MARPVPAVDGPEAAALRAAEAWRRAAPAGPGPEALLRHGLRLARLLLEAVDGRDPTVARALAVGAVLHAIGFFVADRGHFAARGARWAAIHLDEILPHPTPGERLLVGELILFHRHQDRLPGGVHRPRVVDRFRRIEAWDRAGAPPPAGFQAADLEAAEARHPRGRLRGTLRRLERAERLRHPLLFRRVTRIRRPDRQDRP